MKRSTVIRKVVNLGYSEGRSDKVYNSKLVQSGSGWKVKFTYGRRYSWGSTYYVPDSPVSLEKALFLRDKKIHSKLKKGYSIEEEY